MIHSRFELFLVSLLLIISATSAANGVVEGRNIPTQRNGAHIGVPLSHDNNNRKPKTPFERHNKFRHPQNKSSTDEPIENIEFLHESMNTDQTNLKDKSLGMIYNKTFDKLNDGECACSNLNIQGQAVIIVVDSNSGSTWLGQLVDSHKCTKSFIPPDQRADGHFRPKRYTELLLWMRKVSVNARGRAYGVLLPWQMLERMITDITKRPRIGEYNSLKAPRVLFYSREPIFQAISLAKKSEIVRIQHTPGKHIACKNVNQRGDSDCKVASSMQITPTFKELSDDVQLITEHQQTAYLLSKRLAAALNTDGSKNFLHLTYSELVCTSKQHGNGYLPPKLAYFLGLNPQCPTRLNHVSSVKSSPSNPAAAMTNLGSILKQSSHMKWHDALLRPYEAFPCHSDDAGGLVDIYSLPQPRSVEQPLLTPAVLHDHMEHQSSSFNIDGNKSETLSSGEVYSNKESSQSDTVSSPYNSMFEEMPTQLKSDVLPRVTNRKNHVSRQGRQPSRANKRPVGRNNPF